MIQIVPMHLIDGVWPHLMDGMHKACIKGGGQFTEGWLYAICRRGEALLVVDPDTEAAVVVQEQNWSGRTVLNVLCACGKQFDWGAFVAFAKANFRVNAFVFEGRPGWGRKPGVKVVRHVYEMDISQ